jgi:integrase
MIQSILNNDANPTAGAAAATADPPKSPRTEKVVIDEDLRIRIYKTAASPVYYVQYNLPGTGQVKRSLRTKSKKEAESRARRIARDLEAGTLVNRPNRAMSIEQAAERHLTYLGTRNRSRITRESYKRTYNQLIHWGKPAGVTLLTHLNVGVLEQFEKVLREQGIAVPLSNGVATKRNRTCPNLPKTVRDKMKIVRSLLKWAAKRPEILSADPSLGYELPPGESKEIEIFSPTELRAILSDPDPVMADIWSVFLHTGLRADELCWLLKTDIQQDPCVIHIHKKTCPQTGEAWSPKQGMERMVPVTDARTREILIRAVETSPGPWLFWAPDTYSAQKGHWQPQRLLRLLGARLRTLAIDHGTLHVFRHTFCSFLANRPEMPLVQVQKIMGHKSILTTMKYVHTKPRDVAQSMALVDFGQMLTGGEKEMGAG